jgi:opacity protein-like surface antigen
VKVILALSAFFCAAALAAPASAQVRPPPFRPNDAPGVSLRPFVVIAEERFSARKTFDTVFGQTFQPLWGGGLSIAFRNGFFVDVTALQFKKTGQRAFFFEGQGYGLQIPLKVTVTPLEVTAGGRTRVTSRLFPYVGFGVGSYRYQETSEFDDGPFDKRHIGYLIVGGVEIRVSRWIGVSADAQYTRVTGIIGTGGVSKEAGESDLGGTAGRFRLILGR